MSKLVSYIFKPAGLSLALLLACCCVLLIDTASAGEWKPGQVLTTDNWGRMVGFAPDLKTVVADKGNVKDSNYSQYASVLPQSF